MEYSTQITFDDTRHWVSLHCLIRSPTDLAAVKQSDSIKFLYSDSSNWWEFRNPTFSPRPYSDHFPPLGRGKQWYSPQDKDVNNISRITIFSEGSYLKPPPPSSSIFALKSKNLLKTGIKTRSRQASQFKVHPLCLNPCWWVSYVWEPKEALSTRRGQYSPNIVFEKFCHVDTFSSQTGPAAGLSPAKVIIIRLVSPLLRYDGPCHCNITSMEFLHFKAP